MLGESGPFLRCVTCEHLRAPEIRTLIRVLLLDTLIRVLLLDRSEDEGEQQMPVVFLAPRPPWFEKFLRQLRAVVK